MFPKFIVAFDRHFSVKSGELILNSIRKEYELTLRDVSHKVGPLPPTLGDQDKPMTCTEYSAFEDE